MKILILSFSYLFCIQSNKVIAKDDNILNLSFQDVFNGAVKNFKNNNFNELQLKSDPTENFLADSYLKTPELIRKYGYPVEEHTVQTCDGYLLTLHRIPRKGGYPVFLQHGILDSSAGWVIAGPKKSLAYILADQGYDVWMGNSRGNTYSRDHVYFNIESKAYWDFSFHEMGAYDLPSMFDHVINQTGYSKMHYIAHSQGTTAFFIMCSLNPDHCKKITLMSALSPVVYLTHVRSRLIKTISLLSAPIEILFRILGVYEILPNNNELMKMAGQVMCKEESMTQCLCTNLLFLICGYDSEQLNRTLVPVILGHIPAGASLKQMVHFGQLTKSKKFRMYDYGMIKNLFVYNSIKPKSYDLSKVNAPIAMYYAVNDWLADPKDVYALQKQLPNVVHSYIVPMPKFNHLDFLFAEDAGPLLYDEVLRKMKTIEMVTKVEKDQTTIISNKKCPDYTK